MEAVEGANTTVGPLAAGTAALSGDRTAVIYLRVSTKEQAEMGGEVEGYSIPAQREACLRKAGGLRATVIEEFVDRGESAKTADRPELQRLLAFVKSSMVDYVIVHKVLSFTKSTDSLATAPTTS